MESPELGKSEALARADTAWNDWQAFLDRQSKSGRADERGTDGWTLAEAMAHIARWQEWSIARIRKVLGGGKLEELPIDEMNARWAREDVGIGPDEATRKLDAAWQALRAAVESIPEKVWSSSVERVFAANTWEHYEEHKAWRPDGATLSH